jgi:hypothetical protein
MAAPKTPKPKLDAALRANLRRRKVQQQARAADSGPQTGDGVRYSGFAVRDKPDPATET